MLTRGHEIPSLWLETKESIYVFMSYLIGMLSWKKWIKRRHPMELVSHGLRIEKCGRECALIKWLMNKRFVLGVLINEVVNWCHVLWWKCSATQLINWPYGWTAYLCCSRYSLLLVSYTMIITSFAKQQSCEVSRRKDTKMGTAESCGINKIWFNCPTCNGCFG
jgi:hypothetical protein